MRALAEAEAEAERLTEVEDELKRKVVVTGCLAIFLLTYNRL